MKNLTYLFLIFFCLSCQNQKYKDISSSHNDKSYYNLFEKEITDNNGTVIKFSIPNEWDKQVNPDNETLVQYVLLSPSTPTGYIFSIRKLESRNTIKLNDKEYLDIMLSYCDISTTECLDEMGKLLPPNIYKNNKVVDIQGLIINNNYFGKRVSYFQDGRLDGSYLEDINITEFQFITLQNKRKYTINISYIGEDKGLSELIGFMNTIGGSVKFY